MSIRRKRTPAPISRSTLEEAAIHICANVYGKTCACEKSPSVCETMVSAARACLMVAAPDVLIKLSHQRCPMRH